MKNESNILLVRGITTDPEVMDNPNFSCRSYIIEDGRNIFIRGSAD